MEFAKKIVDSTEEIFNTMIFMDISTEGCMSEGKEILFSNVSAIIGLSGDFTAMLSLHCSGYIAMEIAGAMLGMELEKVDADVKDALGEITNMIAGGIKERFAGENIKLELAIPTTITGKSYSISSPTRSNRVIIPFDLVQGQFFVEMKYSLN